MNRKFLISLPQAILLTIFLTITAFSGGVFFKVKNPSFLATQSSGQFEAESFNKIYSILQNRFDGQIDPVKLMEGARMGFVMATGDPYTAYLDAKAAKQLEEDLSGTISGIGAEIGMRGGRLVIIAPIADSPAAATGLRAGDEILMIDEEDTSGMALDVAVAKIRGPENTKVTLKIGRPAAEPLDVTITRKIVTVKSVEWSLKEAGIGYVQLSRFGQDTAKLIEEAANDLKRQGATKIILDLRNNPGGYLDASIDVAGEFIEQKVVVEERKGGKSINKLSSGRDADLAGLPTVVLINGGSASASEIVAGALQDHGAATLIGEKSFGKGSIQEIAELGAGAKLKITIAHWYTPGGKNIDQDGIKPDMEVQLEQADFDNNRDPQLDRAVQHLTGR